MIMSKWWYLAGGVVLGAIVGPKLRSLLPINLPTVRG